MNVEAPPDIQRTHAGQRAVPLSAGSNRSNFPNSPAERARLAERATAMVKLLRERAPLAEAERRLPDATLQDFHRHGLFRLLQPARVGGYEFDPSIYIDVGSEIATGCASSAWVLVNLVSHHQFLAQWDARAQQDVWDPSPDTLIGSSYIFTAGQAEHTAGGYRVSGRWPFSSGIDACAWVIVGAGVARDGPGGSRESRYFLMPRSDYAVSDTWHVVGLRGTGSKDVECKNVFVPEHRTLSFDQMANGTSPGLECNSAPLFRLPLHVTGGFTLVSVLYGAAKGALADYIAMVRTRSGTVSGKSLADLTAVQTRIAEADACLDAVELIVRRAYAEAIAMLAERPVLDAASAVRHRRNAAFCAQLCVRAVDLVFNGCGGAGLFDSNHIQRAWRDVHAGAAQFGLQWDVAAPAAGRLKLGLPSGLPGIAG